MNNNRKNTTNKRTKRRTDQSGRLRVPPPAIAYMFDSSKRLKFVYPEPGVHPDVTIRRHCKINGVAPRPGVVHVTKRYFSVIYDLPSSVVDGGLTLERIPPTGSIFDPPNEQSVDTPEKEK
jgi:hypothetical protein